MVQLEWADLTDADIPALRELAAACMDVDGGMPSLDSEESIRRLFRNGRGRIGRDVTGDAVAAAAIFRDGSLHPTATGLVHPSFRGVGVGASLYQWARSVTDGDLRLLIENDSEVTDAFAHEVGMVKTFGETVMRHSLRKIPQIPRPEGLTIRAWTAETVPAFHRAWAESFAERPGFTAMDVEDWRSCIEGETGFLPEESRVVLEDDRPVGFVTVSRDWIDQAGVVPDWRGRGLGAHLMVRSLSALQKLGSTEVWLSVTDDNASAQGLYERLGFTVTGHRGRYAVPSTSSPPP